ncbi:D-alanyl-D-alanine dipeptidase [candidate division KSB1 bacterium]|nr:D-alanyl-D-alanine dipeptidase [candidate division KSB1 bacterium]
MQRKLYHKIIVLLANFLVLSSVLFAQEFTDLVDVTTLDSTIVVDLRYATKDNFMEDTLYSANICLLRRNIAEQLVKVHQRLRNMNLGLKIWDAYRPLSVQKKMWEKIPDPRYVADPARGSNHNRGAAVDVTLVDSKGNELEMPTEFDDFSQRARSDYPDASERAKKNRTILQQAMTAHGFLTISSEWWHFNYIGCHDYSILDVPLEKFLKAKASEKK